MDLLVRWNLDIVFLPALILQSTWYTLDTCLSLKFDIGMDDG